MKRCTKCGETKLLGEFSFRNRRAGKRHTSCKSCRRVYYVENRASIIVAVRKHYRANRDRVLRKAREYRKTPAAFAVGKAYRQRKKKERAEYDRRRRLANPRDDAVRAARWRARHPEKDAAKSARYRAKRAGVQVETVIPSAVFARDGYRCGLCGEQVDKSNASVDHVIPLALGGEHSYRNVQTAHRLCNSRKGARSGEKKIAICDESGVDIAV